MALPIFSTAVLNRVVDSLIRPQSGLLTRWFPNVAQSEEEKIYFDVMAKKRRITPFVHPTHEGKVVEGLGSATKDFEPAYVKDLRVFDPNRTLKRTAGETIGGSKSPQARHEAILAQELADQADMLNRRLEVMASEVLRTGKVTVDGEGYDAVEVDFGRDAGHTVALTGTSEWGDSGIVPIDNIEDWSLTMAENSGASVTDIVMDTLAWRLFQADQKSRDSITNTLNAVERNEMNIVAMAKVGLSFKGQIGGVNYWVYTDWYLTPAEVSTKMIPDYTCMLLSSDIMGTRHFGAIRDEESGWQAREMFTKSWVTPNPSVRLLLSQSAPLVVPYRPDASFCATVHA